MRHLSRHLRREWEWVVCGVATVLLLVFLADWALSGERDSTRTGSGRIVDPSPVLGPRAFAFLQGGDAGPAPTRNPFHPQPLETPVTQPERSVRRALPKPPPEPAVAPPPVAEPAAEPGAVASPPPAAPARPRLAAGDVRYVFSTVNRSGRPIALIEIHDPANPGAAPLARNVGAGDMVYGLRVQSFTDQALILTDAAGRRQSVGFGSTRRVAMDTGAGP